MFEELLREVWVGISNTSNSSGANATDGAKIAELAKKLQDMLLSRRVNGNLSREEFVFVSMMSWFHLTVSVDSPDHPISPSRSDWSPRNGSLSWPSASACRRTAFPKALRYRRPDLVGSDPYRNERLRDSVADLCPSRRRPRPSPNSPQTDMNTIITHWSLITGRDMKAGKVAVD